MTGTTIMIVMVGQSRERFTLCLLVPSVDNLCKQFGSRLVMTKHTFEVKSFPFAR